MTNRWMLGTAAGVLAAQAQVTLAAPSLEQCRALQDAQARLACYDGLSGTVTAPAPPPDPTAAKAAQEEKFGLSSRQQASKEGLPEIDEVHAKILEVSGTVVRLDNGQSWRMTSQNSIHDWLRPGQSATIKRGVPSGFRLHVEGLQGMETVRRLN